MSEVLVELSDDAFEALVNGHVRGSAKPGAGDLLRSPENCRRWLRTLLRLKRKVEAQFVSHRADRMVFQAECLERGHEGFLAFKKYEGQDEKWRSQAVRFLHGLEESISEAKQCVADNSPNDRANEVAVIFLQAEVEGLKEAICEHRDHPRFDTEPASSADEVLWSHVRD